MVWSAHVTDDRRTVRRVELQNNSTSASYGAVLDGWRDSAEFRSWFSTLLAEVPFDAFRWETPPLTSATRLRAFECVVVDAPELLTDPDPAPFREQLEGIRGDAAVVSFANLGRDAILVVPRALVAASAYAHLAAFVRHAPDTQRHALWQAVAAAMQQRVSAKPTWLSTAGAGVAWLHVRLDDRPKYYSYAPYKLV